VTKEEGESGESRGDSVGANRRDQDRIDLEILLEYIADDSWKESWRKFHEATFRIDREEVRNTDPGQRLLRWSP
jgi:hypothetical protein